MLQSLDLFGWPRGRAVGSTMPNRGKVWQGGEEMAPPISSARRHAAVDDQL
jgi:hypothetical protein